MSAAACVDVVGHALNRRHSDIFRSLSAHHRKGNFTQDGILRTFFDPNTKGNSYGSVGGILSGAVTIADDVVARILPDRIGGMLFVNWMGGSGGGFPNGTFSGCGYFDVGASPSPSLCSQDKLRCIGIGGDGDDRNEWQGYDGRGLRNRRDHPGKSWRLAQTFNYTIMG